MEANINNRSKLLSCRLYFKKFYRIGFCIKVILLHEQIIGLKTRRKSFNAK